MVLYQPEIPPNTGSVIRLCANLGCDLHLIEPLGFTMDDSRLRRAGLDYHEFTRVRVHQGLRQWRQVCPEARLHAFSVRGQTRCDEVVWQAGDALLFGPESRGLPASLMAELPASQQVYLPMVPGGRSVNLSNAVAVGAYFAWRALDFAGAVDGS